ncbi:YlmH/Sll1252 family protein [Eubacterium xylanophilum]|uniref:YlmH/Sll1252 family protein n=1 Tax=Eubacterium xylanophilum TaxID=39497 RepID=UPI0006852080|nr:YlmH/Sll1252 family protein [Eubacterium xylanophilum]
MQFAWSFASSKFAVLKGDTMEFNKRIIDLANRAYNNNQYTFTSFLSEAEVAEYYSIKDDIDFVRSDIYGGYEMASRCVVRFGDPEYLGYEEKFPVDIIHIEPLSKKFSEKLGHRDVLGALINLGIKREVLGDIIIGDKDWYVFCLRDITEFILDNLTKIRRTNVKLKVEDELSVEYEPERIPEEHIVSSPRIDAIIAKVYKLSRSAAVNMFRNKLIFVNGRQMENNAGTLGDGDIVSVRGMGKFQYDGIIRETKKGKYTIKVEKYGK